MVGLVVNKHVGTVLQAAVTYALKLPGRLHRLIAKGTIDVRMKDSIDGKGKKQDAFLERMKDYVKKLKMK